MSSTSLNINDLLIRINSSSIWAFFFFLKFRFSNYDIVSTLYNEGNVDEKELICIINKSKTFTFLQWMLPSIIRVIRSESFTNSVVETCINYPTVWRDTLLESVAHKDLSLESLQKINETAITPEAFYKLVIYYLSGYGNLNEFNSFLDTNKRFIKEFNNHGQEIIERFSTYNNSNRRNAIKAWCMSSMDSEK